MISIKTFSGQLFQTIHVTEDDITYNDLLKYIKIPPHPRFKEYEGYICLNITVKPYIKFFHINVEVNLNDIIDFDSELTIGFYFEYYAYGEEFGDDFNLPDTSTHNKCKTLIENCPFNIIFINNEILRSEIMTEEIYKNVVRWCGYLLEYIPYKKQTDEICKLAVQQNGYALQFVEDQTKEICITICGSPNRRNMQISRSAKWIIFKVCKKSNQRNMQISHSAKWICIRICGSPNQKNMQISRSAKC